VEEVVTKRERELTYKNESKQGGKGKRSTAVRRGKGRNTLVGGVQKSQEAALRGEEISSCRSEETEGRKREFIVSEWLEGKGGGGQSRVKGDSYYLMGCWQKGEHQFL